MTQLFTVSYSQGEPGNKPGILEWFGRNRGQGAWANPLLLGGAVFLEAQAVHGLTGAATVIADRQTNRTHQNGGDNFFLLHFPADVSLALSSYSIQCDSETGGHFIRNWVLEASKDRLTWVALDTATNRTIFTSAGQWANFPLTNSERYNYVRLRQTGPSHSGSNWFPISELELFGTVWLDAVAGSGSSGSTTTAAGSTVIVNNNAPKELKSWTRNIGAAVTTTQAVIYKPGATPGAVNAEVAGGLIRQLIGITTLNLPPVAGSQTYSGVSVDIFFRPTASGPVIPLYRWAIASNNASSRVDLLLPMLAELSELHLSTEAALLAQIVAGSPAIPAGQSIWLAGHALESNEY